MAKIRKSKLCERAAFAPFAVVLGGAFASACGASGPSSTTPITATELPTAARRPDGVVIEPPAALPAAGVRAEARGVVALREPVANDAVHALVKQILSGFEEKDPTSLEELLADDVAYYVAGRKLAKGQLLEEWRRRLSALDFSRLSGMEVVRFEKIQRFDYDELGGPGETPRPPEMVPGDLYVKVPIDITQLGGDKFFGDMWILVLRPDSGRLHIVALTEQSGGD